MTRNRLIVLLFCLIPCLAHGAPPDDDATLLTDAEQLARLGFPADARNVYLAAGVELERASMRHEPEEFGTLDAGFTTVLGNQHAARANSEYDTLNGGGDIYAVSGGSFYEAQFQMPNGALWEGVQWWGLDDAMPGDLNVFLIRFCAGGVGLPTATVLGNGGTSGTPGEVSFFVATTAPTAVDNHTCTYVARTSLNVVAGIDVVLRRVRAQWRRQVSPAPLVATFPNDVPATHPYFRFVEALASAGITAGCLPATYCVNNPITRGEMAVFLAAALGLHWP
jgi:hypothetical protein